MIIDEEFEGMFAVHIYFDKKDVYVRCQRANGTSMKLKSFDEVRPRLVKYDGSTITTQLENDLTTLPNIFRALVEVEKTSNKYFKENLNDK